MLGRMMNLTLTLSYSSLTLKHKGMLEKLFCQPPNHRIPLQTSQYEVPELPKCHLRQLRSTNYVHQTHPIPLLLENNRKHPE